MKKFYRGLALMFALLMIVSTFIGCKGDDSKDSESTTAATTEVASGDTTTDPKATKLPDMDWQEAEFMVLGNDETFHQKTYEIARDEMPDDVVGKAVYERNDKLREKYNFIVRETLVRDPATEMRIRYNSGEDYYDAVIYTPTEAAVDAQAGFLLDLNSIPHIDLTHPAWNQYATQQLTIAGKTYFTVNDFLISDKNRYFVLHYNREMAREAGKGYLEDMVENNTWTYDNFNALITEFAEDGDGDGKKGGLHDKYGVACETITSYSVFLYGGGFRLSNNNDGVITMAGAGNDILKIINKASLFALNTDAVFYPDYFHKDPEFSGNAYGSEIRMFTDGDSLFLSSFLEKLDALQEKSTFERAYMPYPKYDEKQENYYTMIWDLGASVITIPYTVADREKSGFMLQALTEISTDTSYKAYFEEKCKLQGSVDQRAADMLDLIFENVIFDAAFIYDMGELRHYLVLELPLNKAYQRYNKVYNGRIDAANKSIAEITAAYAEA